MSIQWYPGHMAKTKRMLSENLKIIDIVVELADARAPLSTRNPDFEPLFARRPRLLLLNKADLADERATALWVAHFERAGIPCMAVTSAQRAQVGAVISKVRRIMEPEVERMRLKGVKKTIRAMVVGIPNVGKSTFINNLRGKASAKAADRPGVTRGKQWIVIDQYLEFMDTPGMLWPKLADKRAAQRLAYLGAVRDEVMDLTSLACAFLDEMIESAPGKVQERFRLSDISQRGEALFEQACRARGWILSGGRIDMDRGAAVILDEFRAGKLGRVTLELLS